MTLSRLSRGLGTDKGRRHSYLKFYDKIMKCYKDEPLTLLEIGVDKGWSLILWNRYFKNARIIGIDNNIKGMARQRVRSLDRVELLCIDAYTEECVNRLPMIDIFIDDGPHTLESQLFCIKYYLPKVKHLFIIEDIQSPEDAIDLLNAAPDDTSPKWINLNHERKVTDNILYVIDKSLAQSVNEK